MDSKIQKLREDLNQTKHAILQIDHLVYVVYPYIGEKKLIFTKPENYLQTLPLFKYLLL